MILRKLGRILKSRPGFTLTEIMVSMAIISLIAVSVTTATVQILQQSAKNRDYTTASQFTMNAIHWINRDAEMAQAIQTGGDFGFPLTLTWTDWGSSAYQVIYSIEDGVLKRNYSHDGDEPVETILAQSIDTVSGKTACEYSSKILTLQITAIVGRGDSGVSVSNTHQIFMRSMP
jgi:prepilin-type N-terminal cleavage/methylation domain-containing protein